jgi:hypothetical protein
VVVSPVDDSDVHLHIQLADNILGTYDKENDMEIGAREQLKMAKYRGKGVGENDSKSPFPTVQKTGSKRWWDSFLVGIGMTAIFVVIILKLTDMLPRLAEMLPRLTELLLKW